MSGPVVIVDWLGRGGIAQISDVWRLELGRRDLDVVVVTRPNRELKDTAALPPASVSASGRLRAHWQVARRAAAVIASLRPTTVVVQNFVIPIFERIVHDAARRSGAQLIFVIHDHRLHSRFAGMHLGLTKLQGAADVVVAHSVYVGDRVAQAASRPVDVIPLPVQIGMLDDARPVQPLLEHDRPLALHFGVVKRQYKGTRIVEALAAESVPGWTFGVAGVGAPAPNPHLQSIPRFLSAGELCSLVADAAATLLPYTLATQSGAVVLSQALGAVPVASAVGGIPEQIEDDVTGILVGAEGLVDEWRQALDRLSSVEHCKVIGEQATQVAWCRHEQFVEAIVRMVA